MKAYCAVKKLTQTEFERKAHLEKRRVKFKQQLLEETEYERDLRLDKHCTTRRRYQGGLIGPFGENTQQHYLNEFDA